MPWPALRSAFSSLRGPLRVSSRARSVGERRMMLSSGCTHLRCRAGTPARFDRCKDSVITGERKRHKAPDVLRQRARKQQDGGISRRGDPRVSFACGSRRSCARVQGSAAVARASASPRQLVRRVVYLSPTPRLSTRRLPASPDLSVGLRLPLPRAPRPASPPLRRRGSRNGIPRRSR